MKFIGILIFTIVSLHLYGQQLNNCGQDNSSTINNDEARFLNLYLADEKNKFDFSSKKIAFVTGSGGSRIGTKNEYFKEIRECNLRNSRIATSFIAFTDDEKVNSGGYDAIITYWVKISIGDKTKRKIVDKLKSATKL